MSPSGTQLLEAVRALAPSIAARSAETEEGRRLPPELLVQLKEAGLLRMFVPRSLGGLELDLPTSLEVLEQLARADGAVGWTVMIGSETPQLLALLPQATVRDIYAQGADQVLGGGFNAQGEARVVPGGYHVTGRWAFASGSEHCDWLFGNCVVLGEDGRPRSVSAAGVPELRAMVFPARKARVHDTWRALGLRGTGSHDISVEALFVPEAHTFDLFGGAPCLPERGYAAPLLHFALHMGAVAVGIAQGAVEDAVALARGGKKRLYASAPLAESPLFQHQLGQAEAAVRAARAALQAEGALLWRTCLESPEATAALAPRVTSTLVWGVQAATGAVDALYRAAGGSVARDGAPLQRRFRDVHTLAQHGACTDGWYTGAGAALLGAGTGGLLGR
jgi:alkylation response protein AidB-like acyl-CoA dehydrogenase